MFTGIIETLGAVQELTGVQGGARLTLAPQSPLRELAAGESIAIDGVCLTAESASRPDRLQFFLSAETLSRSTLAELRPGAWVNLERALRADSRLGGHLVLGHVDAIGTVRRFDRLGEDWTLEVAYPAQLAPYLAEKGSVAVDGISLTLAALSESFFSVAVIPHTAEVTNLRQAASGTRVNLEADVLARYVVRALQTHGNKGSGAVTEDLLRRAGF
jgi:riboflavin synthase